MVPAQLQHHLADGESHPDLRVEACDRQEQPEQRRSPRVRKDRPTRPVFRS